jgi:hypothetical protein
MSDRTGQNRRSPERSQKPLWFAVVGLAISLFSETIKDQMIGDVVMLFGVCFTVIALAYYVLQPKHGLR